MNYLHVSILYFFFKKVDFLYTRCVFSNVPGNYFPSHSQSLANEMENFSPPKGNFWKVRKTCTTPKVWKKDSRVWKIQITFEYFYWCFFLVAAVFFARSPEEKNKTIQTNEFQRNSSNNNNDNKRSSSLNIFVALVVVSQRPVLAAATTLA